jgi:hypothetical protein
MSEKNGQNAASGKLSDTAQQYFQRHKKDIASRKKLLSIILSQQKFLSKKTSTQKTSTQKTSTQNSRSAASGRHPKNANSNKACSNIVPTTNKQNENSTLDKCTAQQQQQQFLEQQCFQQQQPSNDILEHAQRMSEMVMERKQMATHCYLRACHMRLKRDTGRFL